MKFKGLCLVFALAVGFMGVAQAQDAQGSMTPTDSGAAVVGKWYVAPYVGGYYNDSDRNTNSRQAFYGIGVGTFLAPNVSLDLFWDETSRDRDSVPPSATDRHNGGSWINNSFGAALRYYFGSGRVRPYALVGGMGTYHIHDGDHGWAPGVEAGGGVAFPINYNAAVRLEAAYRYDMDDDSIPANDGYGDWYVSLGLLARFGQPPAPVKPAPVVAPTPPPVDCSTLDADSDGVNNCVDKCPNTTAGTIVGPDGCVKTVVIDLRGVNFKFDRPHKGESKIGPALKKPTADSIAILDQAVDTLTRYPAVKVELDGYTDSIGTDAYNQKLSQRRAQIVDDYLTSHGIDASRITAVKGFGESDPIATNKTRDGRAQNRRTELSVQNPNQPQTAPSSNP